MVEDLERAMENADGIYKSLDDQQRVQMRRTLRTCILIYDLREVKVIQN